MQRWATAERWRRDALEQEENAYNRRVGVGILQRGRMAVESLST